MKYTYRDIHELLVCAYLDSRKNERGTNTMLGFEVCLEENLAELAYSLYKRAWKPSGMNWFVIDEPTVREVFASQVNDKIVSHLVYNMLAPIFERYFIFDSFSCRKGKGTLLGIQRFEHHLRSATNNYAREAFVLNLDISGYFMSINRKKLYDIIWDTLNKHRERFPDALDYDFADYVISGLVFRNPIDGSRFVGDSRLIKLVPAKRSLFGREDGVGIPIGDVNNQLNSNIYLNPFDQYAKRELGLKHYCRYVDDIRVIHTDEKFLRECIDVCGEYLDKNLGLHLHPEKTRITSSNDTNIFLGAAIKPFRRYAKGDTVRRFREYIGGLSDADLDNTDVLQNLNSRLGYLSHFMEKKMIRKELEKSSLPKYYNFNRKLTYATIKTT